MLMLTVFLRSKISDIHFLELEEIRQYNPKMSFKHSKQQKMTSQEQIQLIQTSTLRMPFSPLQAFIHKKNHFSYKTMSQLNAQQPNQYILPQNEVNSNANTSSDKRMFSRIPQNRKEKSSLHTGFNELQESAKENPNAKTIEGCETQKSSFKTRKIYIHQLITIKEKFIGEQYELLEKIGEGTYGQVFRGLNKQTKEERAIKIIKRRLMSEHKTKQFLAETSLLKKISHPSIIRVYDLFQHQNNFYVVLEYCKGGSIQASLKSINFKSQRLIANIMKQVLAGLAYLHSLNIVHRDIKADNIVFLNQFASESIQETVPIKIIDFGTAIQTKYKIEHSNSIAGTLPYLAPEVFKGFITDKSDIWSCAVLMIKMLTGVNPLAGATRKQTQINVIHKILNFHQKPFSLISDSARALLQKMFQRNFHKRLSATELLQHAWFDQVRYSSSNLITLKQLEGYEKRNNFVSRLECYLTLWKLTQSERQKLAQIFTSIDKDNSGLLDKPEFLEALRLVCPQSNQAHLRAIIDSIDKDKSGKIDFNEFLVAMAGKKSMLMRQSLQQAFELFDSDRTGFLEKKELKKILADCSGKQVDYFISRLDTDKDQLISKQEFIDYLQNA